MNLTITQDNTRTETINSFIIDKLYEIAFAASSDPNSTVSLTGRLESPKGYKFKIDWLNSDQRPWHPNLTITVPAAGQYIFFADSNVETVLKANNISSDGNGVTLADAAAVTTFNTMFKNNTDITSFDELLYFTNYTNIQRETFKGCTALTSVTLPSTLTSIGGSAFAGCTSLQINGSDLSNVTSISAWAFADITINGTAILSSLSYMTDRIFINSKVTSIDFTGSSITTIRNDMCTYVSQLTSVTLSPTITTIEGNAFMLTGLTSIDLSNITNIGNAAFKRCGSLSSVTSMGNIVSIGDEAFRYCTTLHTVDLGANLTSVGQNAFGNSGITTFIFRSTTPPAYSGKFIDNMTGVTIYVPDAVVLDYQTAWPGMASNITGLTNYSAS